MYSGFLYTTVTVIAALLPLISSYKHFQMLQQNSYFPSRYIKWLYDSYFFRLLLLTFVFFTLSVVFKYSMALELGLTVLYALGQIGITAYTIKKSIKKLVFTARVRRLYTAAIVIEAALCFFANTTKGLTQGIFFSALILLAAFAPVLVTVCWVVTAPIEKLVTAYYINDAKKIITGCPSLRVIGVTGSYGKTSTKCSLSRILSEKFNVVTTPQSYNTPMGVVKTVREQIRPQTEIFVCEMGAKNIGDIKEICDIVNPTDGMITSVGPQHLETFKTIQNVFKTKFELYDACVKNGGKVFVNNESAAIKEHINGLSVKAYGINGGAVYAENITYGKEGSAFTIVFPEGKISVNTKLLGKHNVINITGAAALAYELGVTPEQIAFAVSRLEQTEHRLELKSSVNGSYMIDDAYNANPEGCIEAVSVLSYFKNMKRAIITPGLVELGEKEYDFNYKLGLAAAKVCDKIILVGRQRAVPMQKAVLSTDFDSKNLHIVSSFAEAMEIYSAFADNNTVVLVENDLPDNYLK